MARGRMINRSITKSKKFNRVKDDFARLVYLLLLPFADRDGRLDGDPRLVYADLFPLRGDIHHGKVEKALTELDNVGLVEWYEVDGEKFLQVVDFGANQMGMKYNREAESRIPPPNRNSDIIREDSGGVPELILTDSGSGPSEWNGMEDKGKGNLREKKFKGELSTGTHGEGPSGGLPALDSLKKRFKKGASA